MNPPSFVRLPGHQRGAALVVVLLLLLIMTVLGLASLRNTLMEERMSSSLRDRSIAFQSAEAGLREGEALLEAGGFTIPAAGCSTGLCARPLAGTTERWVDPAFAGWRNGTNNTAVGGRPQFFIELMGPAANWPGCDQEIPMHPNCLTPRYRITARNNDPTLVAERAQVLLQSNYAAPTP